MENTFTRVLVHVISNEAEVLKKTSGFWTCNMCIISQAEAKTRMLKSLLSLSHS